MDIPNIPGSSMENLIQIGLPCAFTERQSCTMRLFGSDIEVGDT